MNICVFSLHNISSITNAGANHCALGRGAVACCTIPLKFEKSGLLFNRNNIISHVFKFCTELAPHPPNFLTWKYNSVLNFLFKFLNKIKIWNACLALGIHVTPLQRAELQNLKLYIIIKGCVIKHYMICHFDFFKNDKKSNKFNNRFQSYH